MVSSEALIRYGSSTAWPSESENAISPRCEIRYTAEGKSPAAILCARKSETRSARLIQEVLAGISFSELSFLQLSKERPLKCVPGVRKATQRGCAVLNA